MRREGRSRPAVRKGWRGRVEALAPVRAIPLPLVICVVYVGVFRLLHLFLMCSMTFDDHAQHWLQPATWGMSLLTLAKITNLAAIVYLAASLACFVTGTCGRKRACAAAYVTGLLVLVMLQVAIRRTGDLAWHTCHLRHAAHVATPALERAEHFARAIELFPRVALSEQAYLGRAHAYRAAGQHELAVECYVEYIRLVDEGVYNSYSVREAHCGMGLALWALGEPAKAEEALMAATGHGLISPQDRDDYADHENLVIASLLARPRSGVPLLGRVWEADAVPGIIRYHEARGPGGGTIRVLGNIGDRRAVPAIMRAVALCPDICDWYDVAPAEALGEIGDPRAVPCLLYIIDDRRHGTRCGLVAYHALQMVLEQDPLMPPPSRRMGVPWSGWDFADATERSRLRSLAEEYLDEHPADRVRWNAMLEDARALREGF